MSVVEIVGRYGVGGEVSGLIRVWKSVEKSKPSPSKDEGGVLAVQKSDLEAWVDRFGFEGQDAEDAFVDAA